MDFEAFIHTKRPSADGDDDIAPGKPCHGDEARFAGGFFTGMRQKLHSGSRYGQTRTYPLRPTVGNSGMAGNDGVVSTRARTSTASSRRSSCVRTTPPNQTPRRSRKFEESCCYTPTRPRAPRREARKNGYRLPATGFRLPSVSPTSRFSLRSCGEAESGRSSCRGRSLWSCRRSSDMRPRPRSTPPSSTQVFASTRTRVSTSIVERAGLASRSRAIA
jgi:hypothetical protein